ncbi:MAG TPA: helix-turn-helix transcriptional regulator [Kofleriaceae bacterium]|jgi:transcriptional regulator with XRE-family HTH domain
MTAVELLGELGEMIRTHRVAAGMTQRALGERAGIVGKYVSEIERGTRDIPLSTLVAIVEYGLKEHLMVSFRSDAGSLPAHVADLASAIAELPTEVRSKLIPIVRGIIDLSR